MNLNGILLGYKKTRFSFFLYLKRHVSLRFLIDHRATRIAFITRKNFYSKESIGRAESHRLFKSIPIIFSFILCFLQLWTKQKWDKGTEKKLVTNFITFPKKHLPNILWPFWPLTNLVLKLQIKWLERPTFWTLTLRIYLISPKTKESEMKILDGLCNSFF